MQLHVIFQLFLPLMVVVEKSDGISSPIQPFTTYKHSVELQVNVADLWWTVNDAEQEIIFELHVKTTGWIALGISPGRTIRIAYRNPHFSEISSWWNERS
jgi:hypothetical protein